MDAVELNKVFHDHECAYYDERFGIVHDDRSAAAARKELEGLLGRGLLADEIVLDVGCGTGWFAAGLQRATPGVRVIGLDLSTGMLRKAAEAGADNLVQGDATSLPLADSSVDIVVGRGVLHHLPDPAAALTEWRRVLKPDGSLVLSSEPTPVVEQHGAVLVRALLAIPGLGGGMSAEDEFWELAAMAANLHTFTLPELRGLFAQAGFEDVRVSAAGFAATLTMTASYVTHGHAPRIARHIPWRPATSLATALDRNVLDRVLPERLRHTLHGVARP